MNFKEVLKKYKNLRPQAKRNFDQFYATDETVIKRTEIINSLSVNEKKVLFLGDDDLNSVALALTQTSQRILVIDIDKEIINFINKINQEENLNIETLIYDLRNPLPKKIKNFNIVFFDPPYTPLAINIWLMKAIEASLGRGSNKKRKKILKLEKIFYLLCYGYTDKETEKGWKIQKIITDLGLVIFEKYRNFNLYEKAKSINNQSDLYILKPTPKINLKILDNQRSRFYTYQT